MPCCLIASYPIIKLISKFVSALSSPAAALSHACMISHFSCVQFFVTLWTVVCQTPLPLGFSQQEYLSGLPFPPPGDLPDPGIEPTHVSCLLRWQEGSLPLAPPGKAYRIGLCNIPRTSQVKLVIKNLFAKTGDVRDAGSVPGLGTCFWTVVLE